ncbi:hypothetical protein VB712_18320 [Spirulina sp. CCNP1310]|uniref:hypothetical protein n=1 Tax=Spirulina sp. CCNP1310 TaxID=3110249 RepID=UPI002B214E05|nr:hypothetical protein [Spirulina sp. CCNP1310]MEA5421183.1 hypothetical protein [Spirulina sp. CCNP1310]
MLIFLLTTASATYLFSGSVCYLAIKAENCRRHQIAPRADRIQQSLLWPLWLAKEINSASI